MKRDDSARERRAAPDQTRSERTVMAGMMEPQKRVNGESPNSFPPPRVGGHGHGC